MSFQAKPSTPLIHAINAFVEKRISALPIVDNNGRVIDLYAKFDVIVSSMTSHLHLHNFYFRTFYWHPVCNINVFPAQNLAADKTYNDLDVTIEVAMKNRRRQSENRDGTVKVETCTKSETLKSVIARIVKAEVSGTRHVVL